MDKILVIEDNVNNADLLKDFLESWSFKVYLAYQGVEGLAMAQEVDPDVILLDVMLPGMSGFEVCKELRSKKDFFNTPIIMISALSESDDRINGYDSGADAFLVKPINYNELKALLERMLKKRRAVKDMESNDSIIQEFIQLLQLLSKGKKVINFKLDGYDEIIDIAAEELNLSKDDAEFCKKIYTTLPMFRALSARYSELEEEIKIFGGFSITKKMIVLLEYCTFEFDELEEYAKDFLKEDTLSLIADISWAMGALGDLSLKKDNGGFNLFKEKAEKFGLQKKVILAIEKALKDYEIRLKLFK